MSRYKVAIIGSGGFASQHVFALRSAALADRVEIAAVVNRTRRRGEDFCATHTIPAFFDDTQTMLETIQPDIVHICTSPDAHVENALLCLAAGAHVLCEKPLCGSLADADRLLAAEAASAGSLSTVFQWRFGAGAQYLRRLMADGALGRLYLATCLTLWHRDAAYWAVDWRGKWQTALGGVSLSHGIHLMDLLLYLAGDWQSVNAMMATLDAPIEVENLSLAQVRFADGGFANIVNSTLSPREESTLRFDFAAGTVTLRALYGYDNGDWDFSPRDPADAALWRLDADAPDSAASLTAQVRALVESIDHGEKPLTSGAEGRRSIEFLSALYKSAITQSTVRRGEITPDDAFYYNMRGPAVDGF